VIDASYAPARLRRRPTTTRCRRRQAPAQLEQLSVGDYRDYPSDDGSGGGPLVHRPVHGEQRVPILLRAQRARDRGSASSSSCAGSDGAGITARGERFIVRRIGDGLPPFTQG
jgi:hypothetical protein